MIKLNNLSLDFAGNIIFRNISLQINKSDRIGLIGNNGSGKTTLLNLLSKIIVPTLEVYHKIIIYKLPIYHRNCLLIQISA